MKKQKTRNLLSNFPKKKILSFSSLHFSVEIWSLLDELQKVTRVKSKYEDDAWDAAAKYTTHNTIQAIE